MFQIALRLQMRRKGEPKAAQIREAFRGDLPPLNWRRLPCVTHAEEPDRPILLLAEGFGLIRVVEVARRLREEGAQMIELCGGFGH